MAHRGGDGGHGATRVDEQARVRVAAEALVPGPATQRASYGLPARKRMIATGPAASSSREATAFPSEPIAVLLGAPVGATKRPPDAQRLTD
jgi:hypothetical protein